MIQPLNYCYTEHHLCVFVFQEGFEAPENEQELEQEEY